MSDTTELVQGRGKTLVDSSGDGRLWDALLSQAAADETLSRALLEFTRTMVCGAGAAGLVPNRLLSGYAAKDDSACEVITAAHTSLGGRGRPPAGQALGVGPSHALRLLCESGMQADPHPCRDDGCGRPLAEGIACHEGVPHVSSCPPTPRKPRKAVVPSHPRKGRRSVQ